MINLRDLSWHPLLDPFRVIVDIEEGIQDTRWTHNQEAYPQRPSESEYEAKVPPEFHSATPVSELTNKGISVSLAVRPVAAYIDKSITHTITQVAKQFVAAFDINLGPLSTTDNKSELRNDTVDSVSEYEEILAPNAACWEFINNTQYKVHMGRLGSTEDYLLLPCSSLFHHWNVWLQPNVDSQPSGEEISVKSGSEQIEVWGDNVDRENSTWFQFDKSTLTNTFELPLFIIPDARKSPEPQTVSVFLHVIQQGLKTRISIEGSHKIVNFLDIPVSVDFGITDEASEAPERQSFGSTVSRAWSVQQFAVPLIDLETPTPTEQAPQTELEQAKPVEAKPNDLRVTFFPRKDIPSITQTVRMNAATFSVSQLLVHPEHVIGVTVDETITGTTRSVHMSFKNILRVQNLCPFAVSCKPAQIRHQIDEEGKGEDEIHIGPNEGKTVHVKGAHEGIRVKTSEWSKDFAPIPFDLDKLREFEEPDRIIQTGNFELHVRSHFNSTLRQIVMVVYLPFYFYNLTTKTLLFKPEYKESSSKDKAATFVDSGLDPFVVLPGTYQTPPKDWEDWLASKEDKFLSLGVPSNAFDQVSWSYPFTTSKPIQTLASIKTRARIYSRFSLVVQKTDYITAVTIRPRVVLINRTKSLLHVDNTHNIGIITGFSSSGQHSPSSSSTSTPRSSISLGHTAISPALTSTSEYGVLLAPNAEFSLNEWKIKSISELGCVIRLSIVDSPADAQVRHQWSSEIEVSQPTELNHVGVPKSGQLTPIILKYSIVEHEGVLYVILLPTPNPPLTIINQTDDPFVYTLGATNKASLIPAKSSVECYWESEQDREKSAFSTSSLKQRNVLTMKSPNRLIRFGKLGGLEWSSWLNTRAIGVHDLRFNQSRPVNPNPTKAPISTKETESLAKVSCSSSGGCSILNITSVLEVTKASTTSLQPQPPQKQLIKPHPPLEQPTLTNLTLSINIAQINVRLINDDLTESIHTTIDELSVFFGTFYNKDNPYRLARECFHVEATVQEIQIDSHLPEAEFPVVLCRVTTPTETELTSTSDTATTKSATIPHIADTVSSPFLKIVAIFATNSEHSLIHVDHVDIGLVPFMVNVDDQLITKATELADEYTAILSTEPHNPLAPFTNPSENLDLGFVLPPTTRFPENLINILEGSEFYINYMYLGAVHIEFTLHAGVGVYLGLGSTPIDLSPVDVQDIECLPHHVGQALVQRYVLDLLSSSPAMLGSLDVLGNPTLLWHDVVAGFSDFFSIPVKYVQAELEPELTFLAAV